LLQRNAGAGRYLNVTPQTIANVKIVESTNFETILAKNKQVPRLNLRRIVGSPGRKGIS
jgi:hypothetical protein